VKKGFISAEKKFEFGLTPPNDHGFDRCEVSEGGLVAALAGRFVLSRRHQTAIVSTSSNGAILETPTERSPPAPRLPADVIARTSREIPEALNQVNVRSFMSHRDGVGLSDWDNAGGRKMLEECGVPLRSEGEVGTSTPDSWSRVGEAARRSEAEAIIAGDGGARPSRGGVVAGYAPPVARVPMFKTLQGLEVAAFHSAESKGSPGGDYATGAGAANRRAVRQRHACLIGQDLSSKLEDSEKKKKQAEAVRKDRAAESLSPSPQARRILPRGGTRACPHPQPGYG